MKRQTVLAAPVSSAASARDASLPVPLLSLVR